MSETLRLHYQDPFNRGLDGRTDFVVTAIEMADGRVIRGRMSDDQLPEMTFPLSWHEEKAERVAEFYGRYLAEKAQPLDGWNCHKFVLDVMGWNVLWSTQGYAYYQSLGFFAVKAPLVDETPYAMKGRMTPFTDKVLSHSMMGLPDPNYTLGVEGRNAGLWIMSNTRAERYGKWVYEQKEPFIRRLGKAAHILRPSHAAETFPL